MRMKCVKYKRGGVDGAEWCALKGDYDPEGWNDETLCGANVALRIDKKFGKPDCPKCLEILDVKKRIEGYQYCFIEGGRDCIEVKDMTKEQLQLAVCEMIDLIEKIDWETRVVRKRIDCWRNAEKFDEEFGKW